MYSLVFVLSLVGLSCVGLVAVTVAAQSQWQGSARSSNQSSGDQLQCVENPTGEVGLRVTVRGVPGPKGDAGNLGAAGRRGPRGGTGIQGRRGFRGPEGHLGAKGTPGDEGARGERGYPGLDGARGIQGRLGFPGPRGPHGEPGDGVLADEDLTRVTDNVSSAVLGRLREYIDTVEDVTNEMNMLKRCGFGDWVKVVDWKTRRGDSCPSVLTEATDSTTGLRGCGNSVGYGCSQLNFTVPQPYSRVCGRVRGYQYYTTNAFDRTRDRANTTITIESPYVDGVSFTQGSNPRRHLWTYAVGFTETHNLTFNRCPCSVSDPSSEVHHPPAFVGDHYYCESGFPYDYARVIAWEDALWDGKQCLPGNKCCNRFGWFSRTVERSSDDIHVRLCMDQKLYNENVYIDELELYIA